MKKFECLGIVTIRSGILRITKEQADARHYGVKNIEGDLYEVFKPVQFKAGESFSYDGELPKTMAHLTDDLSAKKAAAQPEAPNDQAAPKKKK